MSIIHYGAFTLTRLGSILNDRLPFLTVYNYCFATQLIKKNNIILFVEILFNLLCQKGQFNLLCQKGQFNLLCQKGQFNLLCQNGNLLWHSPRIIFNNTICKTLYLLMPSIKKKAGQPRQPFEFSLFHNPPK
jgi:hypothetical protein